MGSDVQHKHDKQAEHLDARPAPAGSGPASAQHATGDFGTAVPDIARAADLGGVPEQAGRRQEAGPGDGVLVGKADDPAEREAETVARQVVQILRSGGQQVAPVTGAATGVARSTEGGADPLGGTHVGGGVKDVLERRKGGGAALPDAVAQSMGAAFGQDFNDVRVHTGAEADSVARSLQATAFTRGSDIYFSAGTFAPGSESGQHLLAHELTHVVQNKGPSARRTAAPVTVSRTAAGPDKVQRLFGLFESDAEKKTKKLKADLAAEQKRLAPLKEAFDSATDDKVKKNAKAKLDKVTPERDAAQKALEDHQAATHSATLAEQKTKREAKYAAKADKQDKRLQALKGDLLGKDLKKVGPNKGDGASGSNAGQTGAEDLLGVANTVVGGTGNLLGMERKNLGDSVDLKGGSDIFVKHTLKADGTAGEDDTSAKDAYDAQQTKASQIAGGFSVGTGTIGFLVALQKYCSKKEEKGWEDHADLALGTVGGAATLASGALSIKAGTVTGEAAQQAQLAAAGLDLSFFVAVKDGVVKAKALYDLFQQGAKATDQEKARACFELAGTAATAGKAVVDMLRNVLSATNNLPGPAMAAAHAAPGLGIAIGTAEVIVRTFDLFEAFEHAENMRDRKRDAKAVLGLAEGAAGTKKAQALLKPGSGATLEETKAATDYLHFKGVQYVQDKNARRAMLNIGIALQQIAGDAATLGGASAPVGMGLKLSAAITKVGSTIVRNVKQFARDQVQKSIERDQAKLKKERLAAGVDAGEVDKEVAALAVESKYGFNLNKTSDKKLKIYQAQATRAIKDLAEANTADKQAWMHAVQGFEATGMKVPRAVTIITDGKVDLHTEIIKTLQKRE